jgi:hypothetical protein
MTSLPYVTATGNVDKALKGIKSAATPETVSQDFVKTILKIRGGSGNQITAYLKKIGFASADGKPTEIYKKFRNSTTEGAAAAAALKTGYAPLYVRNEYMHKLDDNDLKGLIVEVTGVDTGSAVVGLVLACIKQLKKYARWDGEGSEEKSPTEQPAAIPAVTSTVEAAGARHTGLGLNLGYTINLNLPATSDVAVFNAIFRALKEHLLKPT